MKPLTLLLFLIFLSCQNKKDATQSELIPNDTIRTGTGLQYYYIKKGEGPQIEEGSKVAAYNRLYLNDVDTVFWASEDNEDSTFTFIQGKTSLIKGALELYPLLREGDELVAIIPDSLGYGKEDSRGLPGGSTLIFNPIIIKSVSKPKLMLSDTLYAVSESGSVEDIMKVYQNISASPLKEEYFMDLNMLGDLLNPMLKAKKYEEVEQLAIKFEAMVTTVDDKRTFWYSKISATASQGDTARAISYLNEVIAQDPDSPFWKRMLSGLEKD